MHRCLIVCKSVHHGNTARVAGAMAGILGANVVSPEGLPFTVLDDYLIVGFGSGVYHGRVHPALLEWIAGLPDAGTRRPAFVFTTSGLPFLRGLWHLPLRRLLRRKGFVVVGEFACSGFDTWGPLAAIGGIHRGHPDRGDLERAAAFARSLRGEEDVVVPALDVPGARTAAAHG